MGVPFEFIFSNILTRHHAAPIISTLERNIGFTKMTIQLGGNPGEILDDWVLTEENINSGVVKFSTHLDDYLEAVRNKQIQCVRGEMKGFCENGIELTDGRVLEADAVILATGYYSNYSYFSEEILDYEKKIRKFL